MVLTWIYQAIVLLLCVFLVWEIVEERKFARQLTAADVVVNGNRRSLLASVRSAAPRPQRSPQESHDRECIPTDRAQLLDSNARGPHVRVRRDP